MVSTTVFHVFHFAAAHTLPKVPEGHKCRRLHGHTYTVRVTAGGPVGDDGFVVDYDVIRKAWAPVFGALDHNYLNDVPGLDNPTCELIAEWIGAVMWPELAAHGAYVAAIQVQETESAGATVTFGPGSRPLPSKTATGAGLPVVG